MVEWKKIDDIIISLKTGLNPRANFVLNTPESKIPYITGKDIFENRINVSDKTDMIDKKALRLINKRACLDDNLLLFASTGTGTVGRMAIVDKYNNDWGISETLYAIKTKDIISPYFLMYCLYSHNITKQFEPKISKGSVPHLKVVDLLNVQIPIPSLDEQNRIVGILDTFTASIDNLKEQIAQRHKQYEYYRDQLLDLEGKEGVEMKTLGEVCSSTKNIKWRSESDLRTYYYIDLSSVDIDTHQIYNVSKIDKSTAPSRAQQIVETGDILLGTTRPTLKRYCLIPEIYNEQICSTGFCIFRANSKFVSNKWIYYNIANTKFWDYCERKQQGAGYPSLSNSDAFAYIAPIPPLSEQQRIVDILDKFEASIQNLEAQLSQREKQYEYYRNKLLTFE